MSPNFRLKHNCARRIIASVALAFLVFGANLYSQTSLPQQDRQLVQTAPPTVNNAKRIALVIGNGAYTNAPPLKNPPNDARDMAATLKVLGFNVASAIDADQRTMKRLIREFGQQLKAGGQGLFYYAGHGVQMRGRNYLIPANADITSETDVEDQAVDLNLVLGLMDEAQNGLNIVVLDACRNNPFSRSFRSAGSGLAQVDAPTGTLIAYATSPGRVASDGTGRNGLYTSELLAQMRVSGIGVEEMFKRVRASVQRQTTGQQVPWESSSLVGNFYFAPSTVAEAIATDKSNTIDPVAFELSYWDTIKTSANAEDFKAYLEKYPNGQFAELARNKIKSLEGAAKPSEPSRTSSVPDSATEMAFWDYIKNSTNVEDFKAYLKKYPNGTFADLAANRVAALEAVNREKEKAEAAKRLEAEAARPLKAYEVEFGSKSFLYGETYDSANLLILKTSFRIERKEEDLRSEAKVFASIYHQDEATALEGRRNWYEKWDCRAFKSARIDKLLIREIQPTKGDPYRLRFKSATEATEALGEIQRICKATP